MEERLNVWTVITIQWERTVAPAMLLTLALSSYPPASDSQLLVVQMCATPWLLSLFPPWLLFSCFHISFNKNMFILFLSLFIDF